jgi:PadR family transcriptional regulator, regulatory protein PadR
MVRTRMAKGNPSFLNGVPELLVLQLLSRREMYGYELVREIQRQSHDAFSFGEGCVYPYLHYLESSKFIASRHATTEGRSRLYYRLTLKGQKRLAALAEEWNRVAQGVALVIGGAHA